ncbi:hypothetical protein [Halodesulfurarchaeum sp.]|uniref:hypothetical protein n=1 Tax=Halodesulfurarchaeum sp. TaxID=1980530 RepID=UPI001BB98970|nr:hypothetical protein [Halodesulfurarchaeum sp.]
MERRTVLRATGTVLLGLTAGCLGDDEPEFMLRVVNQNFGAGPDGNLTVWVTVSNPGNERQSGTVYVKADLNDDSMVRVRDVTLDAHETTEIQITYDQVYDDVTSFTLDASVEESE